MYISMVDVIIFIIVFLKSFISVKNSFVRSYLNADVRLQPLSKKIETLFSATPPVRLLLDRRVREFFWCTFRAL